MRAPAMQLGGCARTVWQTMGRAGSLRMFVAVYPPVEVVDQFLRAVARLDLPPSRAVPAEQVHLTLQFIGDVRPGDLADVRESVRRSVAGITPMTLTALRVVSLPRRGPARLVAIETDAPADLCEAHRRLTRRLARAPRDRAGDAFLPHLTLARFGGGGTPGVRVDEAAEPISFRIDAVKLMRSVLTASGAEHREDTLVVLG